MLDNLYVQIGDKLLLQTVGIPMGVSCAPFLANLMLFMYEFKFIDKFITKNDPLPFDAMEAFVLHKVH